MFKKFARDWIGNRNGNIDIIRTVKLSRDKSCLMANQLFTWKPQQAHNPANKKWLMKRAQFNDNKKQR